MSKRYVARVAVPRPFRRGRSRTDEAPVARGVATPPADGAVAPAGGASEAGPSASGAPATPPPAPPVPERAAVPAGGPSGPAAAAPGAAEAGPARGVATPPDPPGGADATQMMQASDVTAAIFVDRSGRRAQVLRRVVSAVVLLALLVLVALWVSQGLDALGLRAAA